MDGRLQAPYASFKLPRRGHLFAARSAEKRRSYSVLEYVLLLTSGSKLFSVNFSKSKTRGRRETGSRARLKDATAPRLAASRRRRHAGRERITRCLPDATPRPQRRRDRASGQALRRCAGRAIKF